VLVPSPANIRTKVPDEAAPQVLAEIRAISDAPTLDAARAPADRVINRHHREFPAAVARLSDDLETLLAIHRMPVRHRINVRTTNLVGRSFVEERRRTKVIPTLLDEKPAMKLVFATLIRSAQCWSRTAVSDLERHQLQLLHQELGIDPPPTSKEKKNTSTQETVAA